MIFLNLLPKKKCSKCGEIKFLLEFVKEKRCIMGRSGICLDCSHKIHRKYGKENRTSAIKRCKKHREANKDKINNRSRELRAQNVEERRLKDREYYKNNRGSEILKQKRYRLKNKEKIAERSKRYRLENIEKINKIKKNHRPRQNELDRLKRKTNPKWKLNRTISNYIYQTLKGKKLGKHWENIVGYTLIELKQHLEKHFTKNMSWENYGDWHIDHKIPISVHNFTKSDHEDFKKCWALSNLQPMWALENVSKGAKLTKPFQQSLLM